MRENEDEKLDVADPACGDANGTGCKPGRKGFAIAREMDERDQGWVDQQASLLMVLRNKHGQQSTREIRVRSLEVEADGDKSLTISTVPRM